MRGFGVTNVEDPLPITPETVFPLASISKTVAATAIMRRRAGQDGSEAPVRRYVPEFSVPDEAVTPRCRDLAPADAHARVGGTADRARIAARRRWRSSSTSLRAAAARGAGRRCGATTTPGSRSPDASSKSSRASRFTRRCVRSCSSRSVSRARSRGSRTSRPIGFRSRIARRPASRW